MDFRTSGKSDRGKVILPETVEEMVAKAGKRKTPILILAGEQSKTTNFGQHGVSSLPVARYQDDGCISFDQKKHAGEKLAAAKFPVETQGIPTKHFTPLPPDRVAGVWGWLKERVRKEEPLSTTPRKN